jgi:hypothetical protein
MHAARHHAGIKGLPADRGTGISPAAAARHGIERLALRGGALAGLDAGAARPRVGSKGLAAERRA